VNETTIVLESSGEAIVNTLSVDKTSLILNSPSTMGNRRLVLVFLNWERELILLFSINAKKILMMIHTPTINNLNTCWIAIRGKFEKKNGVNK
jgi:hypothetical protein